VGEARELRALKSIDAAQVSCFGMRRDTAVRWVAHWVSPGRVPRHPGRWPQGRAGVGGIAQGWNTSPPPVIKHLQRGCVTVQRDPTGRIHRRRLHSLAFKGEAAEGVSATWVVTEPVAHAVAVQEALQPAHQRYLFALLPGALRHAPGGRELRLVSSGTTIKHLTDFVTWINDYCTAHARTDGVPEVGGRAFHLISRQFRRTLAWYIARRPGGTIAGALQYRHQSIHIFESYDNPRELHQPGEKPQVASSQRRLDGLRRYYGPAV
jgi:hypothetical protein